MSEFSEIINKLKENGKIIDKFLDVHLQGPIKNLWDAGRHYILAGGKRLRPFLVCSSYKLLQKDINSIIPIASAVEVLHNFTLIHDDIMDQDEKRRNVPTVHVKWGEPIAILAGDLLFSLVFVIINESTFNDTQKSKISLILGKISVDLCNGQAMDMNFEQDPRISLSEYIEMIRLKTGALLKASMSVGGIAAGMNSKQLQAVEEFGENLGLGFQIADDILGLIGDEAKLGKPIGSDIREGKKTYLALHALEHLPSNDSAQLLKILTAHSKTEGEIEQAKQLILKANALDVAQKNADSYIQKAIQALTIFVDSKTRQELEMVAKLSVNREN